MKVFPADSLGGAPYLRSVLAPLPNLRLVPSGGVKQDTIAAFLDAGAYGLALFSGRLGMSPWLAVLVGVAGALACALLIGGVSFRLRGPYFVLSTIAFAEILRLAAKNLPGLTGGDVGVPVPALFHGNINRSFYWAAVALASLAFALTVIISRAKFGYYLMAIREDEDTALSVGIDAARIKVAVLLLSAALTAVAGALYASIFLFVVPDQVLGLDVSNEIAIVAMLGGAGTVSNFGTITGGIRLSAGGTAVNAGLISGGNGILVDAGTGVLSNSGTIIGTGNYGVYFGGGVSGTLLAGRGVVITLAVVAAIDGVPLGILLQKLEGNRAEFLHQVGGNWWFHRTA